MTHGDLRVLLAAAAWWLSTVVALLEGMGLVVTVVVAAAGATLVTSMALGHANRGRLLRFWMPTLLVVAVAMLCAAGVTAAHDHAARSGILADLASARATATIRGTVASYPNPAGERVLRRLRVETVEGRGQVSRAHASVMLLGDEELSRLNLDETIIVDVRLEPQGRASREIAWATVIGRATVVEPAGPLSRWIAVRASHMMGHLADETPQVQGLVPGLAIGDDSRIPEDRGEALAAVNLTHLTAVSGAHVSMVCAIALALVGRRRRLLSVAVAGGVLFSLIVATGAQPSVMRAGVMGVVVLGAVWLRRPSSALPALGVSIVVLLALEPTLALAYGFVLSVVSTAAIIAWARPAAGLLAPLVTIPGANLLAVPLVAHVACAPIILLLTDTASVWSALANALVAPVVPAGTVFALCALLLAGTPAGPILAWLAARCVSWIDIVAGSVSQWPGSGIDGRLVLALYAAILFSSWLIVSRGVRRLWIAAAAVGVAAARLVSPAMGEWSVIQCDVGQGAATLFRLDGRVFLVDTGPSDGRLEDCLQRARARVDVLILTHLHADHAGNLDGALRHGVAEVWVGPGMTDPVAQLGVTVPIIERSAGDSEFGVDTLWPDRDVPCYDESCENNQSLVVRANLGQTLLVTGDIERETQQVLARRDIAADIVLIPHHGSPNQDESFAQSAGAATALLSYGDNTYGHPAPSTIDLYAAFGTILATAEGDIVLHIDGSEEVPAGVGYWNHGTQTR